MDPFADDLDHVIALERRLLDPAVRRDGQAVRALLHEDFCEFGASGRVWDREAIVAALEKERGDDVSATAFTATRLATDVILITYRTLTRPSLRTSIWCRSADGEWRLRHHQGTPSA